MFGLQQSLPEQRRQAGPPRNPAALISHIRDLATGLRSCSASELVLESHSLQRSIAAAGTVSRPDILVAGIALASESLRRACGIQLYDVQLLAVVNLAAGRIAQMATGEGKTFVAITTAAHLALAGRGVHVMTPNTYLAERDHAQAGPVLQKLGMSAGLTPEQGESEDKRIAYDADVTYGTGHEFGFDYLRDQLTLRKETSGGLGSQLLKNLRSESSGTRATMQRGLVYAIIDEADSVLVDDAGSPLVLSMAPQGEAADRDAHLAAMQLAEQLEIDTHFSWHRTTSQISLKQEGVDRCYADDVDIPTSVLMRPWNAYVEQALRAKYLFRLNVHYVVQEGEVRIVDETTGRIFEDRSWQDGLHQAIEAREELPITPEKESLAQITRQRFYRLYDNLCGMTGTAVGCEREFKHVYRSQIAEIPLRRPLQRQVLPLRSFTTMQAKNHAIAESVADFNRLGRPVLVGTQSIASSEAIAAELNSRGLPFELLNGLQTKEEADIISQAGQHRAITIATNLAGRGTDIHIPDELLNIGGLHVIVAECQLSSRMDRQLIGRSARQGNPGSAQTFISAEDELICRYGSWLAKAVLREAGDAVEADADLESAIRRLQQAAEQRQFQGRAELLRKDLKRDNLFGL